MKIFLRRSIFCIYIYFISSVSLAQEHTNIFAGMPFLGMVNTASGAQNIGSSSMVTAEGAYAIDMSFANINNQTAYSMAMDNHLKKINTFFQGRIDNRYYRDMEEWRSKEKARLKSIGMYDGEAIKRLYGK